MFIEFLMGGGLVVLTVALHAGGISLLLRAIMRTHARRLSGFWPVTWVVICMTCWLILIHFAEIALWGVFYFWQGYLPDPKTAFYFSGGAYTTAGFGSVLLPREWQMLALLETVTGILLVGLSSGLFFALVNQWIDKFMKKRAELERQNMMISSTE